MNQNAATCWISGYRKILLVHFAGLYLHRKKRLGLGCALLSKCVSRSRGARVECLITTEIASFPYMDSQGTLAIPYAVLNAEIQFPISLLKNVFVIYFLGVRR